MFDGKFTGSDFEDFLKKDGIFEEVDAIDIKRVVALQIQDEMRKKAIAKAELARRMKSSRAAVDRFIWGFQHPRNDKGPRFPAALCLHALYMSGKHFAPGFAAQACSGESVSVNGTSSWSRTTQRYHSA